MTYVTCPNCGTTLTSGLGAEPPSSCPDCCSKLALDAALAGPPPRERTADLAPTFQTAVVTGRDAPGAARRAFAAFCADFDEDVTTTGSLLISEVVTNAVLHGSANGASTIALHFATVGDVLQVEVSDDGPGFDPGLQDPPPDAESGWGLHIVAALAAAWGVDRGRPTRVWFELPLEPSMAVVPS